jgi:hypothetical protein
MRTPVASDLEFLVNHWAEESKELDSDSLTAFSQGLSSVFNVKPNEVAVLTVSGKGTFLSFLVPEKLQVVGTIPLNSTTALVSRTARERRPDIQNAFAGFRHASVFEGVPLQEGECEMIQKIMSAPILSGKEVVGVVQISRKGRTQQAAGPDFGPSDLRKLEALAPTLARFIKLAKKD